MSQRKNWKAVVTEALTPTYSVGQHVGNRAWEIWRGMNYMCLLCRGDAEGPGPVKWGYTHNAMIDFKDTKRLRFDSPKAALDDCAAMWAEIDRKHAAECGTRG